MKIAGLRCHAWALAAATLAGCAAAQAPNQVPPLVPQTTNRDNHESASYVYAAECCRFASFGGNITLYEPALAGVARTITKGVGEAGFYYGRPLGPAIRHRPILQRHRYRMGSRQSEPIAPLSIEGRVGRGNR